MQVSKSAKNGDPYGEHRVEFAHIEGADGVGFYPDSRGRPEWYFTAKTGDGSTHVTAWVFVKELEEPLVLVIDERDGLPADHPAIKMNQWQWAIHIRTYAAKSIENWREERAAA
jgi:hypothetical protein